jgi:Type ISP C-terminal specificity domain
MPGRGRADSRSFIQSEEVTAAHSALLGSTTVDIWMNNASYWRNVPQKVWETNIGGYQVLKKWLSYREQTIIDRALNESEVSHFQATARRLAALLLLTAELDANYLTCAEAHYHHENFS